MSGAWVLRVIRLHDLEPLESSVSASLSPTSPHNCERVGRGTTPNSQGMVSPYR